MTAPKTGIKIVDDTTGAVDRAVSDIGNGLNNVGSQAGNFVNRVSDVNNVSAAIRDLTAGAAKNVERNVSNHFMTFGAAFKGDFTAADNSLINAAISSNPVGLLMNPDEIDTISGTTNFVDQKTTQANEAAAATEATNAAVAAESTMNDIRSVISGQIGARMRSPGRDMTLLGLGNGNANTLLTYAGR